jgi:hypothetical protein
MFLGHYGVALAAKRLAPRSSLGTSTLAAQWVDLLWPVLLLAGVEHVRVVPGLLAASPMDFTDYPWTHSLMMAVIWAGLFGGVTWLATRQRASALVAAALVLSHWGLDWLFHRPDLPLWPGGPKAGLGLWASVPVTALAEAGLFGGGLWLYLGTTRAKDRVGSIGLAVFAGLLALLYASVLFGPPPPDASMVAWSALALWLFVPLAWWVDQHRERMDAGA